jgi:hypothetical protein
MIFAFVEDGSLHIKRDLNEVRRDFEAVDVENLVVTFYDDTGQPLAPVFTRPNRRRKLLGFLVSLEQGEFELQPTQAPTRDPIEVVLDETVTLEPNPFFTSLEEVRTHLLKARSGRGPDRP